MRKNRLYQRLFTALVFVFLYAPIVILVIFSFNDSKSRSVWSGFTFRWYSELLGNDQIIRAFGTTLLVAAVSSVAATLIGTLAAIGIHNMKKLPRRALLTVNNIPITNSEIVTGVSLLLLFVFFGNLFGFYPGLPTLLIAHITFNIPYVVLSVMPKLRQLNKYTYEAALDLGARPMRAFFKIILPEIKPGIVNGLLISFTLSVDDFVISYFTSGSEVETLPMVVYSMIRRQIDPSINALSALLFGVVLALLVVINIRERTQQKHDRITGQNA